MTDERNRLVAVNRFIDLDEAITNDLNDITDLIAQICDTPVALITLLGQDTQWFKAARGVDIDSTPREIAFCNYTIQQEGLLIVPDLSLDERFADNPLVAGQPNARFYAASSLITDDGYAIGSLCVVDFKPKTLDDAQQRALKTLSKQVINLLQLNHSLQSLEEQQQQSIEQSILIENSELRFRAVFDSTNEQHMLIGPHFEILSFNKAAENYIYNIHQKKPEKGENILDYIDKGVAAQATRYIIAALAGKSIKKEMLVRPGTAFSSWREVKFIPMRNNAGEVIGVAVNSSDITQRKLQEEQIKAQNEALTRIAIIQSHELRRPVASLLGLMDLVRMGAEAEGEDYFAMMQTTINELDEKIRLIVKDSEDTIKSPLSVVA